MKKITILLLILALCFALVSCYFPNISTNKNNANGTNGNKNHLFDTPTSIFTYTVRFNTNGGSPVASQKTQKLKEAPETTKENHIFCGWYKDESLEIPVAYPLKIDTDMVLYAKWLRISDTVNCTDTKIKFMDDVYNSSVLFDVTPPRFDLAELAARGYVIKINVEYDVYYKKDYDVLLDIGYAGAPKYEAYIMTSDYRGIAKENLTTSTSTKTRTMSLEASANSFLNEIFYLKFSTDNIQNIIYFKNVKVEYTCYK